jgi:hypothetical protein
MRTTRRMQREEAKTLQTKDLALGCAPLPELPDSLDVVPLLARRLSEWRLAAALAAAVGWWPLCAYEAASARRLCDGAFQQSKRVLRRRVQLWSACRVEHERKMA